LRLRALVGLLLALERRRIAHPKGLGLRRFSKLDYSRDLRPAKWGSAVILRSSNPEPLMSALGQKRTLDNVAPMSALPPKADIAERDHNVCFVPIADKVRRNKRRRYSITSSQSSKNDSRGDRPSALAVFRLTTSSNLIGDCTGRFPGCSPLRMRSTYALARRLISPVSGP